MKRLIWFNNLLEQFISDHGMSLNEFSKQINMPYAKLYRMISGTKLASEKDLQSIIQSGIFSEEEISALAAYHKDYNISQHELFSIDLILEVMENLKKNKTSTTFANTRDFDMTKDFDQLNPDCFRKHYTDEDLIYECFSYAIRIHLRSMGDTQYLYVPTDSKFIDIMRDAFEEYVKSDEYEAKVKCVLIIGIDTFSKADTLNYNLAQLKNITKLVDYGHICEIKYMQTQNYMNMSEFNVFPYYVSNSMRTLVLSEDLTTGLIFEEGESGLFYKNILKLNLFEDLIGNFTAEELNDYVISLQNKDCYLKVNNYTLRNGLTTISLPLRMSVIRLANTLKVKGKEFFSSTNMQMYKDFNARVKKEQEKNAVVNVTVNHFILQSGIERFLFEGLLYDYLEILGRINEYERILMVRQNLQAINSGYQFRIIDQKVMEEFPELETIKHYEFYLESEEILLAKSLELEEADINEEGILRMDGRSIDYGLRIEQKDFYEAAVNFYERFVKRVALSVEDSFYRLQSLAIDAFKNTTDSSVKKELTAIKKMTFKKSL